MDIEYLCKQPGFLRALLIIKNFLEILFVVVPIILIIKVIVDLTKFMMNPNSSSPGEVVSKIVKRVIAALVVFFVPTIVNYALTLVPYDDSAFASCMDNLSIEKINELQRQIEEAIRLGQNEKIGDVNIQTNPDPVDGSVGTILDEIEEPELITNNEFKVEKQRIAIAHYKSYSTQTIVLTKTGGRVLDPRDYTFESSDPGIVSVNSNGKLTPHFGGVTNIIITSKEDPTLKASANVTVIESLYTNVRTNGTVSGKSLVTGNQVTLPANTKGAYNGIARSTARGYPFGDTIRVGGDYVKIPNTQVTAESYYITGIYGKEYVEDFVNTFGFESETNYLFWTSHGSQMEYMFRGSKGRWRLYKEFPVSTGDALGFENSDGGGSTGVHFSSYKIGWLEDGTYSVPVLWKDNGGNGSNPWHIGGAARYPKSHGCTRYNTEDLKYLVSIQPRIVGSRIIDY